MNDTEERGNTSTDTPVAARDASRADNRAEARAGTRWLSPQETETWLSVWSMMVWLPVRLETQLREDAGLSHPEYHALSQISMAPGRQLRLSELATVTNMTLTHLSRVISRLENAGWVVRETDPDDGRYTLGVLTEAGWDKVREVAPAHVEAVRRYVFDSLSPEQARALGEACSAIVEAVAPPGIARA